MAKGKRRSNQRSRAASKPKPEPGEGTQKPSKYKKPALWLGGVATVALAGVLTNVLTSQAQRIVPGPPAPALTFTAPKIGPAAHSHPAKSHSPRPDPSPSPTDTGPPVIVESAGPMQNWQDYSFVFQHEFPLSTSQLAAMNKAVAPSPSAYSEWFDKNGAAVANQGLISVTIAGNSDAPVTVSDMEVVKQCQAPLSGGTLFFSPTGGAGPFPVPQVYFDLDSAMTVGQYRGVPGPPGRPTDGGNFFAKKAINLSFHEPATLSIYVTTYHQFCQFTFQMHIATIHGPVTEDITNNGGPFQITADGENGLGSNDQVPFDSYASVFAIRNGKTFGHSKFVPVDPHTYHGAV